MDPTFLLPNGRPKCNMECLRDVQKHGTGRIISSLRGTSRPAARDVLSRVLSTFGTYRFITFYHVYVLFCSCISVLPKSKRHKTQCTNNPSDLSSNERTTNGKRRTEDIY